MTTSRTKRQRTQAHLVKAYWDCLVERRPVTVLEGGTFYLLTGKPLKSPFSPDGAAGEQHELPLV